jgi:hypothetical protein
MDRETRRERLRVALAGRQVKAEDQSYISQLLSGKASFGEKAARRLERDYLLPAMSLDQPFDLPVAGHLTKDALVARISARLADLHIEKLKALAVFIEA